jgi:GDPmannose 4,6-dehydratase
VIKIDPRYFRPTEVEFLLSDPTKANNVLGWKIETSFEVIFKIYVADFVKDLVREMVEKDVEFLRDGKENE